MSRSGQVPAVPTRDGWAAGGGIEVGAATVDITPPLGLPMGGYALRSGAAVGVGDPLSARTLVCSDGPTTLALTVCDLVAVCSDLVDEIRDRVGRVTGIPPDHLLVAATHTHSGPDGLHNHRMDRGYLDQVADRVTDSVRAALAARRPVELRATAVPVEGIAMNRRSPDGPVERDAVVVSATDPRGATVATLVNHACHATVLEHDNRHYSADFPGATNRCVQTLLGGTAIYLQGACGDVNPLWMRHDLAEVERIGRILGTAAARAALEIAPHGRDQYAIDLSQGEPVRRAPTHGRLLGPAALAGARTTVELTCREFTGRADLDARLARLERRAVAAPGGALRPRLSRLQAELSMYQAGAVPAPGGTELVEVQALRLTPDCALVGLPGEFFVQTAAELRAASPFPVTLVACYANGYQDYFPPATEFGREGYEVGRARYAANAAEAVSAAALRLLDQLGDQRYG